MTRPGGAGQICIWDGGSLWIGRTTAPNDVHAHHAVQVGLALEGQFRFQSPADGVWLDCSGAVIESNKPHAFDGRGAPLLAHLFVEPQSTQGRVLLKRFSAPNGICVVQGPQLEAAAAVLASCHRENREPAALIAAAKQTLELLTNGVPAPAPADPRILLALDYLRDHLDQAVSLEQIAEVVHLSPSHFRHLFVREMGVAYRHYLLWLRLKRALEAFARGESLTTAAYAAGFSDSAHLSRTFRRMYGMAAATLQLE